MAALTIEDGSAGFATATLATPNAGGDTIASGVTSAGGWQLPMLLLVKNADATATTVTVGGVAKSVPATTGVSVIPVLTGQTGAPVAVTYSKVTSLTVAAVRLTPALG